MYTLMRRLAGAAVALLITSIAPAVAAETGTAEALVIWNGDGHVFQVGISRVLFLGDFEGIMYVETDQKVMDEAFARCPGAISVDTNSNETSGRGHCAIHVDLDDTVYADWSCTGTPGGCAGTFTITEGTGKFEGIQGSSPMRTRSALGALVLGMPSGSAIEGITGILILDRLEYSIPDK